ncbi:MAG: hypothetical protein MUC96_08785 [Myxococcaceae bacterium]|nr:hypothetical protein [Myxococcaceae bacterium]
MFPTLDAIRAAFEADTQLTVFVIGDRAKLVLEGYLDGARVFRADLREHCWFALSDGRALFPAERGWQTRSSALQLSLDDYALEALCESVALEQVRATLAFGETIPTIPEHALLDRATRSVALHGGVRQLVPWEGDFVEGASHRARLDSP